MDILLRLIIGILFLVIFSTILFFIIRASKGKIQIQLDDYNLIPGKNVSGEIFLKLKKPQQGILNIGLEGIYITKEVRGKRYSSRSRNIYDYKIPLTKNTSFPAGESSYKFNFQVPSNVSNALNSGTVGKMVQTTQMILGSFSDINWFFYSSLDIPGINLKKKVKVNISSTIS
jgi:sporulation-control protein spo0M